MPLVMRQLVDQRRAIFDRPILCGDRLSVDIGKAQRNAPATLSRSAICRRNSGLPSSGFQLRA
jgi:hypothetical protein